MTGYADAREVELLKKRVEALESRQHVVDEMVDLLKQVKTALRVFVWCGNAFKWVVGLILSGFGLLALFRHTGQP